jgi:hypothetical protein
MSDEESPRYFLGRGGEDEPGLLLIGDLETVTFVARGSTMARRDLEELVRLANLGDETERLAPRLTAAEEAEGQRLHAELLRDIEAGRAWGTAPGADSASGADPVR